ncbi:hypothetical protein A7722_07760 [Yersinia pestis subsp. microtus bv. Caucasica]|nr:hypothetical protein A7725_08145 [Yersinia pestis subsp. microtus bv. Caucasica]OSZ91417.1 hypothetical protein A7722_07760 [Yersinia pestis subsp. microtus bv. Caucasica]OSZ92265.1 hypothetical protein A7720_07410 [Yersinia pestis subsp. microtus bv. Caucasica]OSZ98350.1 hypothetical protein A7721_08015 [Yersinia pestis subsp. microtus bv. Caucasica]
MLIFFHFTPHGNKIKTLCKPAIRIYHAERKLKILNNNDVYPLSNKFIFLNKYPPA